MVFITFYGIICDTFCKFSWEVFPDVTSGKIPRFYTSSFEYEHGKALNESKNFSEVGGMCAKSLRSEY